MMRFVPLALLFGCSAAEAESPEVAFRHCFLEQARALNSKERASYIVAEKFTRNCVSRIASLPAQEQKQVVRDYTCALSKDQTKCPQLID